MGAQTRQSLEAAKRLLEGPGGPSAGLAADLFRAALALSGTKPVRSALADSSASPDARAALAGKVFSSLSADARDLLGQLVRLPWSAPEDIQAALEDLAIRVSASHSDADIVGELLQVSTLVHSDPDLELALGSKRALVEAKTSLVTTLIGSRVSPETTQIVTHLVSDPRGRRIGSMLREAARVVADQAGQGLAMITVAKPLGAAQKQSIAAFLRSTYGREHYLAEDVAPELIGGVKIRVGNDVIDGSIATRLNDVKTQLAG